MARKTRVAFLIGDYPAEEHKRRADVALSYATSEIERSEAEAAGVEYLDTSPWFCAGGQCASFVGNTPVTYDGTIEKNAMKGKMDIGGMVNGTFTATKK